MLKKNNKIGICFLTILLSVPPTRAAFEGHFAGAAASAMSQAGCASLMNANGIFLNPAGLASYHKLSLSMFISRPYNLPELTIGSLALSWPRSWIDLGLASQSYGNDLYRELSFGLAAAKEIHSGFYLGLAIWYNNLAIKNYGSDYTLSIDIGTQVRLNENLSWAASVFNINRAAIGRDKELLPQIFVAGVNVRPVSALQLNVDLYKDVRFPQELRIGAEFKTLPGLYLRTGVNTQSTNFSVGFGIDYRFFELDYALTNHLVLGITHLITLSLNRNAQK